MGIDILTDQQEQFLILRISEFLKKDLSSSFYDSVFNTFPFEFSILEKLQNIGTFVIDYTKLDTLLYANAQFANLFNVSTNVDNIYYLNKTLSSINDSNKISNKEFLASIDVLRSEDLNELTTEINIGNKWLKLEIKILKKEENNDVRLIGGIVYDISDYRLLQDTEYLKSIYELAITSGNIGIFHYNRDKHPTNLFEANDIYARMIGIKPNQDNLYDTADFERAVVPLEQEISDNISVKEKLNLLLNGTVDGTTDDLIKIHNRITNRFTYILSSSKIDERFEDGTPKKFGGIVIDVTERIKQEKNQIAFAYNDELTLLFNNRKLIKDMSSQTQGLGLFFDLDDFKKINDTLGHLEGNNMLKLFADSLKTVALEYLDAVVYRMYGDEFFVFIPNGIKQVAIAFNEKLITIIDRTLKAYHEDVHLEASMGYSFYTPGDDIDDFIKEADYAMYKSKIYKKSKKDTN
jgi:diguanylate cyclase (GGDEF)-like protein